MLRSFYMMPGMTEKPYRSQSGVSYSCSVKYACPIFMERVKNKKRDL